MPSTRSKSKVLEYEEVRPTRVNDENQNLDEDDDDDEDEENETPVKPRYTFEGTEFSNYDDYVEAKRKRNHEFLVNSGLLEAVARKKTKRAFKPRVDPKSAPQRRSSRLAGVESDGHYVLVETRKGITIKVDSTVSTETESFFQNRINDGSDLTIQEAMELNGDKWLEDDTVHRAEQFVKEVLEPIPLFKRGRKESVVAGWETTLPPKIAALSVENENCVAKVTPQRTYCVAAHPTTDRILVCAGDKEGSIGIWDVDGPPPEGDAHNNNVHMFRLYHQTVSIVHWTKDNGILSASYDGSVRKLDVASGCFQEVFATYDGDSKYSEDLGYGIEDIAMDRHFWVQGFTPDHRHDPDLCFFLSTSVGTALHVDLRQGHRKVSFHETLSEKKLNTLSLHPNGYSLASAGNDGTMRIWDVRMFGGGGSSKRKVKSIAEFHVGKSINSAYFSPSGSTLVTTTFADTLDIIKNAHLSSGTIEPTKRVPHDNATGKWLSTFMATWHPSLDIFVVGSMQRPRTMEIFDADGNLLRGVRGTALTSVVSRCCFHPSTDQLILFGSNSSGRVTVVR